MKSSIVAALVLASVVGSTSAFARGGHRAATTGFAAGHVSRDPTTRLAPAAPQAPMQNPISAPLPSPTQAPTINGPSLRSPYGGVMR
jgi:hypothetical protein